MESQQIEITIERFSLGVLLSWMGVIAGVAGLILRMMYEVPEFWWVSAIGLVAGGLGVTFGGPLKTIEARQVTVKTVEKDD